MTRQKLLAILALPAGLVGYLVSAAIITNLDLPDAIAGVLAFVGPVFVAGLCMAPFVIPLFDTMAKRDLAAHHAERARPPDDATAGDHRLK